MDSERKDPDRDRDDEENPFFSCAFCSETSEKPFKICESCGSAQPGDEEEE